MELLLTDSSQSDISRLLTIPDKTNASDSQLHPTHPSVDDKSTAADVLPSPTRNQMFSASITRLYDDFLESHRKKTRGIGNTSSPHVPREPFKFSEESNESPLKGKGHNIIQNDENMSLTSPQTNSQKEATSFSSPVTPGTDPSKSMIRLSREEQRQLFSSMKTQIQYLKAKVHSLERVNKSQREQYAHQVNTLQELLKLKDFRLSTQSHFLKQGHSLDAANVLKTVGATRRVSEGNVDLSQDHKKPHTDVIETLSDHIAQQKEQIKHLKSLLQDQSPEAIQQTSRRENVPSALEDSLQKLQSMAIELSEMMEWIDPTSSRRYEDDLRNDDPLKRIGVVLDVFRHARDIGTSIIDDIKKLQPARSRLKKDFESLNIAHEEIRSRVDDQRQDLKRAQDQVEHLDARKKQLEQQVQTLVDKKSSLMEEVKKLIIIQAAAASRNQKNDVGEPLHQNLNGQRHDSSSPKPSGSIQSSDALVSKWNELLSKMNTERQSREKMHQALTNDISNSHVLSKTLEDLSFTKK